VVQHAAHGGIARSTRSESALRPLATVWISWLVLMTGANLATPLYAVYAKRFGFSSLVLTAIFAAYALVLIPSLLLFGRVSHRFGRRPVLLTGFVAACGGLALFAAARSTAWLFGARVLQGLAVGMISGPATAALVEFDSRGEGRRPALLAGLAQAGGSASGPLLAGVLAEWAFAPRQLPFLVLLGLTIATAGVLLRLPEPAREEPEPWRIQWPRVPAEIRADFARVSVTATVLWASAALFLSIGPSYAGDLLGTTNLALLGALAALVLVASSAALIVSQRLHPPPRRAEAAGLGLLVFGLVGLVVASPLGSLALLVVAGLVAGAGHGLGFLNAQDELNAISPPERRGEVTSAFISCIYLCVALSVIASGLLDRWLSLGAAVGAVAAVLAAVAAAIALWQLRRL